MKTLDEVINIFEKACDLERRCEDCSGCLGHDEGCPNDGANAVPDALYHLKMYRSDMLMYQVCRPTGIFILTVTYGLFKVGLNKTLHHCGMRALHIIGIKV